jgi:hypothetical protein
LSLLEKLKKIDRKLYAFLRVTYAVLRRLFKLIVFCTACVFVAHCVLLLSFANMPLWIYAECGPLL